jgi:hypothetical protein
MDAMASICALALLAAAALTGAAHAANGPELDAYSFCPSVYQPVCAGKAGERRSFGNSCLARRDGFAVISQGNCDGAGGGLPRFCTKEYRPVCGEKSGNRRSFGNACEARAEDFAVVHEGSC